jgi:hypothetical protein
LVPNLTFSTYAIAFVCGVVGDEYMTADALGAVDPCICISMTIVWSAIIKILELGLDADTIVDVDDSPLIAIYDFNVIVSSIYTPGYTLTV